MVCYEHACFACIIIKYVWLFIEGALVEKGEENWESILEKNR